VQLAGQSDSRVQAVGFLEQAEPFFVVALDVLEIIDRIDAWLMSPSLPKGLTTETLRWTRNVEGGLTAQRVQDVLLLIRSYRKLIVTTGATEVWVAAEPEARWLDAVLAACASALGVRCRRLAVRPVAHLMCALTAALRPLAVAVYYFVNTVRLGAGAVRPTSLSRELDGAVVFLLASSLPKHVENVAPTMAALGARGVRAVALCWAASERYCRKTAARQLQDAGLAAIRLEHAVTLTDIVASLVLAARMAWRRRREWWNISGLHYCGVPLHGLLAESARHFLIADLPQRIRIERALAAVLRSARPAALKPWGPEFFEGRAAVRLLHRRRDTLVFHYWLGASLEWPYSDAQHLIDVFLAKGKREGEIATANYALSPAQVEWVGHARFDALLDYARTVPALESRRRLGLPAGGKRFVGFDPGGPLRGFQSVREQVEMTQAVLDAAKQCPDLVILVKPHPAYPIHHLHALFAAASLDNVVVIPARVAAQDFLNAVDILVTKYSTLLLEAALIERVAVSALFDRERRFDVFPGMSTLVFSQAELCRLLVAAADDVFFPSWRQSCVEQQRRSLPLHYFQMDRPAAELTVEALMSRLSAARELTLVI